MNPEDEMRLEVENTDLRRLLAKAGVHAAEQKVAEKLQCALLEELHHRVKNTLAVVMAITSQSLRNAKSLDDGRKAISNRLLALGRVHDLLLRTNWASAPLAEIITSAVAPFDDGGARIKVQSSDIAVSPAAVLPLAMVLNELCTNAVKYGALSSSSGRVAITSSVDDTLHQFRLTWTESGGPPVEPATRRGFGSRLIEHSFVSQLQGVAKLTFEPSGVVCFLNVPLAALKPNNSN
jgi:two-component sensor histidine kinase